MNDMKLKLHSITIFLGDGEVHVFNNNQITEYDELNNGILIRTTDKLVKKYIGVRYLVTRQHG